MSFKKDQRVAIVNPGLLVGTVVAARPVDADIPEAERLYKVEISETRVYRAKDLEALSNPSPKLKRYSPEWVAEFTRMTEALQRWSANNNDRAAWDQFVQSGEKVGLIVGNDHKEESGMDEKEFSIRVGRQVSDISARYRKAKRLNVAPQSIAICRCESQEDFDTYKPEDAGRDFRQENRFVESIAEGLREEKIPVKVVTFNREHFLEWLGNRRITSELRAQYMVEAAFDEWAKTQN